MSSLFSCKKYENASDNQKYMKDEIVKLHNKKNDLEIELKRTPKPNDKEQIKKHLVPINKEYRDIHTTF